jgi:membrane-associated protease RseP (regulator of RpoE activity)
MFWNDLDSEDGPNVEWLGAEPDMVWQDGGPEIAAAPMGHITAGRRVFFHGENRPWLGVTLTDLESDPAKGAKPAAENGVLVKDVRPEGPAAKAGLMKDDVIVEFASEKIRSAEQLRRLVRETPLGRDVTLVVSRAGKSQTLTAKLEARHHGPMAMGAVAGGMPGAPGEFNMAIPGPGHPMPGGEFTGPGRERGRNFKFFIQRGARLGISGDDLTTQLAEYFGVKQGKGVLVREVIVGGAAEKAGLKAGDVVVAVDGVEVASVGKLRRALAGDKPEADKRKVTLTIVRDKHEQTLTVELDSPDKAMPKPAMRAKIEIDTDRALEIADEAAAQAKEISLAWRDRAKTFQTEWQDRLQEELKRLREELPKLEKEVEKQRKLVQAELEKI